MVDLCVVYPVQIKGYEVNIKVTDYSPPVPAKTMGKPEDCYPSESEEISWYACSGNPLLDMFINSSSGGFKDIEAQISAEIYSKLEDDLFDAAESKQDFIKSMSIEE